jgi:pimeloyl-ACP methyl ester carboxylesterase
VTTFKLGNIAVVASITAWLFGRAWRYHHYRKPVELYCGLNDQSDVIIVYIDGAFNDPSEHFAGLLGGLKPHANVLVPLYSKHRYNHDAVLVSVTRSLDTMLLSGHYRQVVVMGGSMGALNVLRLLTWLHRSDHGVEVSVVGKDGALGCETLPRMQRLPAKFARFVRPGPIWNTMLWPLKWVLFKPLPAERWEPQVTVARVHRHVRAMRAFRWSANLDMIATIASTQVSDTWAGIKSVYLRSERDETLDGDAAQRCWEQVFPLTAVIPVPGGEHLTFVEQPHAWQHALAEALRALGIDSI